MNSRESRTYSIVAIYILERYSRKEERKESRLLSGHKEGNRGSDSLKGTMSDVCKCKKREHES